MADGFMKAAHRDMLLVDTDPGQLLDRMVVHRGAVVEKWLGEKPEPAGSNDE